MTDRLQHIIEWILRTFAAVIGIFSEAKNLFHAVLFLIVIDQIMGVIRALKLKEFSWKIFNKVYRKVIIYMVVIMATYVYEKFLLGSDSIYFTKIISAIIGFQELSSAYLNFAKLTGFKLLDLFLDKIKD